MTQTATMPSIDCLVRTHADMVYRLALLHMKQPSDAEDIFQEVFMRLAKSSPVLERAVEVLEHVSSDEYNRMLYEARLKEWRDNKSRIDGAWADGIAVGRAEGKAEARNELFALLDEDTLREVKKKLKLS